MKSVQEILVLKGLAIQKRILLPKGFHPIVPRTERKDAWPSMKLTRGEVALHGAVVFARAAAAHSVGQARLVGLPGRARLVDRQAGRRADLMGLKSCRTSKS